MSFSSWPLAFHHRVAEAVGHIGRHLSPPRLPRRLYHYTSLSGAIGVIDSRAVWATCVEDLDDRSEVLHGVEIVQEEVGRWQSLGLPTFQEHVLSFLAQLLIARRAWTFVACFRSTLVDRERGPYCLEFETLSERQPRLRLSGLHADVQYRRVIYRRSQKRKAIRRAIDSIVTTAARKSHGNLQGPWAEPIARVHARFASQSLMSLIASFKRCIYESEDEWRIVCGPKYSQNLDPDADDESFKPLIKGESKRHVELRRQQQQHHLIQAFPNSETPFDRIYYRSGAEHQRIREALLSGGLSDIEVLNHP